MISLPAGALRAAFAVLARVNGPTVTLPILGCLLVQRDRHTVRLTATNLDQSVSYTHQAEPEPLTALGRKLAEFRWKREAEALVIPRHHLRAALKAVRGDAAAIRLEPGALSYEIAGAPVRIPFEALSPHEFPPFPAAPPVFPVLLDTAHRAALVGALRFSSDDETRLVLNGVFCQSGQAEHEQDGPCFVATDGKRLVRHAAPALAALPASCIFPAAAVKLLGQPALLARDWRIALSGPEHTTRQYATIQAGAWQLQTRLIEGNFPNYRQVIPTALEDHLTVTLPPEPHRQLRDVLAQLPPSSDGKAALHLFFHPDRLTLTCPANSVSVVIPGIYSDAPLAIAVDRHLFTDSLTLGPGVIRLLDEMSPLLTVGAGGALHVLMPIRSKDGTGPQIEDPERDRLAAAWVGRRVRFGTERHPDEGTVKRIARSGLRLTARVTQPGKTSDFTIAVPISALAEITEEPEAKPQRSRRQAALAAA